MLIQLPQSVQGLKPGSTTTVRRWLKKAGEPVSAGQPLVELETEEAIFQLQAPADGTMGEVQVAAGKTVLPGTTLGTFHLGEAASLGGRAEEAMSQALALELPAEPPVTGTPILMPQAGNTMEEGTILKWKVKVGDTVAVGQVLCEIETDKATVEFESTGAGKISWLAAEGSVVPVKHTIATIGGMPGRAASVAARSDAVAEARGTISVSAPANGSAPRTAARADGGRVKASPAARRFAAERGIDLATISTGSGPGGRIVSPDVLSAQVNSQAAAAPAVAAPGGRRAMSKMRKAIALNLQTSKQTVPHFYVRLTINADPLLTFYKAEKAATGCTLNDVILLAVGRLVGEFPAFRTRVEGSDLVETPAANIGVAVSVNDGLVVPVVMNVAAMSLAQLALEARRVVEAARRGKIENLGKGVFTISNMGMLGVEEFAAIINPPESGILAITGARESVIVKNGVMRAGRVMTLTLSADHRVVDGALAAGFMGRLRELLEMPERITKG